MPPRSIAFVATLAVLSAGLAIAPGPTSAQDLAAYLTQHGYLPIKMTKLSTGHETVVVTINGEQGQFLVDSGAGGTVVHSASLEKFSLQPPEGEGEASSGAGGGFTAFRADVQSFAIEGVAVDIKQVRTLDLGAVIDQLKLATGADIDGVVGQDVLTRFEGVLDVRAQTLFLRPAAEATGRDPIVP